MHDTRVTLYSSVTDTAGRPCTLYDALFNISDDDFRTLLRLWKASDKDTKDNLKSQLRLISVSAELQSRAEDNLIITQRNSLMQLDFDYKDNKNCDWDTLKRTLMKFPCVGYCGLSCSGNGLVALVHIAEPEKLSEYFYHCRIWLADYGINADESKGGRVQDLRFISFDPAPLWRPSLECRDEPQPLRIENFITEPKPVYRHSEGLANNSNRILRNCLHEIYNTTKGDRFKTMQRKAFTIGGLGNEGYLDEIYNAVDSSPNYSGKEKKEFKRYARVIFRNGMKKPLAATIPTTNRSKYL